MEIQVISEDENFEILGLQPLPGKPSRYQIDVTALKPNVIYHREIKIRPKSYFENHRLLLRIYYQGTQYEEEIFVSLSPSKL